MNAIVLGSCSCSVLFVSDCESTFVGFTDLFVLLAS